MKKTQAKQIEAINLFTELLTQLQQRPAQPSTDRLIETLTTGIQRVDHQAQTPELEAKAVYTNLNQFIFADHLTLTPTEGQALKAIERFAQSTGTWGGLNSLNTTNMWASK